MNKSPIKIFAKDKFPKLFEILKKEKDKLKYLIIKILFLNNIKKEIKKINSHKNLVFMIVLPNMLHIADIAIKCIPKNMNLVLIMTGVAKWEFEYVKKKYSFFKIIYSKFIYIHSDIIDILIDNLINPFILIDSDCFVFNKDYFNEVKFCKKEEGILGFYYRHRPKLNFDIARTFFLILNPLFLKIIKEEYKVNSGRILWEKLPNDVKEEIKKHIIKKNFFKSSRIWEYTFDTLEILFLLCYLRKGTRFIKKYFAYESKDIFHIGGIDYGGIGRWYSSHGNYISSKILETIADPYLIKKYKDYKERLGKSEDISSSLKSSKFSKELFKKLKIE